MQDRATFRLNVAAREWERVYRGEASAVRVRDRGAARPLRPLIFRSHCLDEHLSDRTLDSGLKPWVADGGE